MPLLHPPSVQRVPTHGTSQPRSVIVASVRSLHQSHHRRPCTIAQAQDGSSSGGDNVDIDALARLLSQKAQALRESYDEVDFQSSYEGYEPPSTSSNLPTSLVVTGVQSIPELEAQVFREVGEGGFDSEDFEILQQLGRISVQQASFGGSGGVSEPQTAVIAYVASLIPRMPLQRQVTSLLKEYLPVAKAVAYNELLVMSQLTGLPTDKYIAAQAAPTRRPPVVPLLGYFTSAPTQEAASISADGNDDSVWLVYKWEGLRPLNLYYDVGPPKARATFFKRKEVAEAEAWEARHAMLRSIARGLLSAVAYCHERGVVHGSLSNGTVLISTTEDQLADDLIVKLDNFGFGRLMGAAGSQEAASSSSGSSSSAAGRRQDLQASGLVLAEAFSHGTAVGEAGKLSRPTLQRLLFEIYDEHIEQFREYCEQDLALEGLLQFLDERDGAGWDFVALLLKGEWSARQMLEHPFLTGP